MSHGGCCRSSESVRSLSGLEVGATVNNVGPIIIITGCVEEKTRLFQLNSNL